MNKLEKLMDKYNHLNFTFTNDMPNKLRGLCIGNDIYINNQTNKTISEKIVTISEEIAHFETTIGNIIDQQSLMNRKQEHLARKLGGERLFTLDDLIRCWQNGIRAPWDIAEELDITVESVLATIENYRNSLGVRFRYKDYCIRFISDMNVRIKKKI
ncbi:hypothetical protein DFO72_101517 [Cytobacillus oceanisediminis]|uniref:IrrE N-terminal-like domain-containing protein n=2 Tax=Cytobacillus TaxID=2675230 RepID=A0A4R8GNU9_9BACI|nr:hypothetical protein [Cytobacillus oceanisediminis]TDX47420.1 hypothetical protein DFO72_101517 [Cytobacillus oceanisediminis]